MKKLTTEERDELRKYANRFKDVPIGVSVGRLLDELEAVEAARNSVQSELTALDARLAQDGQPSEYTRGVADELYRVVKLFEERIAWIMDDRGEGHVTGELKDLLHDIQSGISLTRDSNGK